MRAGRPRSQQPPCSKDRTESDTPVTRFPGYPAFGIRGITGITGITGISGFTVRSRGGGSRVRRVSEMAAAVNAPHYLILAGGS
jgi:hypothetical protein